MAEGVRVVHYLNQFFSGFGGESEASRPVEVLDGAVGPGRLVDRILGDQGSIVATVTCGDNTFSDNADDARLAVLKAFQELRPDLVIAGPAFEAGRYGIACGQVCKIAREQGIPAVTGMHPENPGVLMYLPRSVIVPTSRDVTDMEAILAAMVRLGLKMATGQELGPAAAEGYMPRGIKKVGTAPEPGYKRSVNLLLQKLRGEPFESEVAYQAPENVPPAPPVRDLSRATVALVTTGGLIPKGNPHEQTAGNAQRYFRHDVRDMQTLSGDDFEAYHSGYFVHYVNEDPNYVLPLRQARELERRGEIGRVHPYIYALPGVATPVAQCRKLGEGIARELRAEGVDVCLLVAT
jgi:glycine reductase complex component B subunit gamma